VGFAAEIGLTVRINPSALKRTKWSELAIRILLGGLITALIGMIAKESGPKVGGLFLAFPSIFPAAAALVENHERRKKSHLGLHGETRGRREAALDAAGTAIGSLGLLVFAVITWRALPGHNAAAVLFLATLGWAVVSGSCGG
jgi:hypothetical protein